MHCGSLLSEPFGEHGSQGALVFQDASRLMSGSYDGSIRIWNCAPDEPHPLLALRGHAAAVKALALGRAGEELVSGSPDGTLRVWKAAGN